MSIRPKISLYRRLRGSSLVIYRIATALVLITAFAFALVVGAVRFWLLPNIEDYRPTIASHLSAATKQSISIGTLEGRWRGFNLQLVLGDIVVSDRMGQPAFKLQRVDGTLSWWSLVNWEPRFDAIEIDRLELNIKRDVRGKIVLAGIEVEEGVEGHELSDWLLRQQVIVIRDAALTWSDELRNAPPLPLAHVDFRLENRGRRHRFGLRAVPPEHLATPVDVRGELEGRGIEQLTRWNGQLFAQIDYADIAAWRPWLQFPVSFPQGLGALRTWVGLKSGEISQISADVELSKVATQLGKGLPQLNLAMLKGGVAWKAINNGFEFSTSRLVWSADSGQALRPLDFEMRFVYGSEAKTSRGEVRANLVELERLRALSEHLPIDGDLRKELELYSPRGLLHEVTLKWIGTWPNLEQYSLAGRFEHVGVNAVGRLPGFTGVSGRIDGNDRSGSVYLDSQRVGAELPLVFREKLNFDTLGAHVAWTKRDEQYELKLNNISFSNADIAGNVSGSYQTVADGRGIIDLIGSVTRADARGASRYLPHQIGEGGRRWLDKALIAGSGQDVKLRLKGNLADFPFQDEKNGIFLITARVTGGTLDYAEAWPTIEAIDADLEFRGRRMQITARSATILGVKLGRVRAELPELDAPNRMLTISGEAEGATSEFVNFVTVSPVAGFVDRFNEGIRAQGFGKLGLTLNIPLADINDTKVVGAYTFVNNVLESPDVPFVLDQFNGKLEFTESGVRLTNATVTLLGGPATLSLVAQKDSPMRINAAGRVNVDNLRKSAPKGWVQALQGSTDWRAAVTVRGRLAEVVLDSSLQGITSELPAPLAKTANESLALHLERRYVSAQQDRVSLSLGNLLSAQFQRRQEGNARVIERGTLSLGGTAAAPERPGLWVSGALKSLDLDRLLPLLKGDSADGAHRFELAAADVKFGTLDIFGRRFNDLAINGSSQGGNWQSVVSGRELAGEIAWRAQGKGKITARFKQLVIPSPLAPRPTSPMPEVEAATEWPALDLIAEHFQLNDKNLGRLEFSAVPEGRDWRMERVRVANPAANLNIEGVWQGGLSQPRTMVNLKLEVSDIGRLLVSLGYPEGIRRGVAKLEGPLSWAGNPADFDYASLSGNFVVEASKGQFIKLDPGVGKLLGILSLQSLPRRLTLDFRDIFSEGLAFDEILGSVKVTRGIASTENFRIQGPAVRILMSGDIDLNAETQKLRVKVFPSMSDSLSIAGALIGGPIAGIASYLVQKVLKDPLDQIAAHEYSVTGTWAEPQVQTVSAPHTPPAERGTP